MSRHDEKVWRADLARGPRPQPRLRVHHARNALPAIKVALCLALALVVIKVAIQLAI